jgi:hypothetical protein
LKWYYLGVCLINELVLFVDHKHGDKHTPIESLLGARFMVDGVPGALTGIGLKPVQIAADE